MTAPVIQKPKNKNVAAINFTGFWGESRNKKMAQKLKTWLENSNKYSISSEPMFAGYNPPWTLPFFRRNEVLIELKSTD